MKKEKKSNYITQFELCDRDHFLIVKGIGVLVALIAYFCMLLLNIPELKPIIDAICALFLVCSGYGVSESYIKKRGLVHYWENKIIKVWIPSVVVLFILSVVNGSHPLSWISKWNIGLKGNLLYILFVEYIAFWVVSRFIPKRNIRVLVLFAISALLFAFLPRTAPYRTLYFAFPVGVMFSLFGWKRPIKSFSWGMKVILFISCGIVAIGMWLLANLFTIPYLTEIIWGICYIATAAVLIFFTYFLQIIPIFGIFAPIGMASYGLFLLYDKAYTMIQGKNNWRAIVVIVIILILAVAAFTWLRELLILWNRDLRRRKRAHIKGAM